MGEAISLSSLSHFRVEVYLIGYTQQGESIIVFFRDLTANVVFYSLVIDSFQEADCNKSLEILGNNGIGTSKLDLLCWTHPDKDHTDGLLSIVSDFCNKETKVLIPYGLEAKELIVDLDDISDYIDAIFKLGNQLNRHVQTISTSDGQVRPVDDFSLMSDSTIIPVSIAALSPSNEYIAEKIYSKKAIEKNQMSIALSLDIGPYRFLMTGDVENSMIDKMREDAITNPTWLKIPHHSSTSSTKLLDILERCDVFQLISGTTVKTASGLPKQVILERYKHLSDALHCTGVSTKEDSAQYGLIKYVFDLFGEHEVQITCEGNAHVV